MPEEGKTTAVVNVHEDLIRRMRERKYYDLSQWCAEELEETEHEAEQQGEWRIAKEIRAEIERQKAYYP
ncbi:hypothetical protein IPC325_23835 [Pseudomonas aeruginosa]|uniref:hypothetical protein n=1 Tax=Pseudomonas aeruginosa TaxID=287 RepID=UPI000FC40192|nr:hypothetical protein [Pseudomonas aeruginosa]RUJ73941.1 hypothetical protein IPC325_23835 [Pseudomonas aeruginosa]